MLCAAAAKPFFPFRFNFFFLFYLCKIKMKKQKNKKNHTTLHTFNLNFSIGVVFLFSLFYFILICFSLNKFTAIMLKTRRVYLLVCSSFNTVSNFEFSMRFDVLYFFICRCGSLSAQLDGVSASCVLLVVLLMTL